MIAELLPREIESAEAFAASEDHPLFPAERALIAAAVPDRRAEFATARHCARRALGALGLEPGPVLAGAHREPLWPDGVVGSITHCAGYHAAAVGRIPRFRAIGIDAERDEPLPDEVLDEIALPVEREQSARVGGAHWDRLLFSAKESVFKAWFPLAHRWLGFDDARVTLNADGTFDVDVTAEGPLGVMRGRWLARDGLVLTTVAIGVETGTSAWV